MKTETIVLDPKNTQNLISERYEVVSSETLSSCKQKDIIVSGSLLSQNMFSEVIFIGCVFFGSKIEDCEFAGCTFIDCKFEFSTLAKCNFSACQFQNVIWNTTNIVESLFTNCSLDAKTMYHVSKYDNEMRACFREIKELAAFEREAIAA